MVSRRLPYYAIAVQCTRAHEHRVLKGYSTTSRPAMCMRAPGMCAAPYSTLGPPPAECVIHRDRTMPGAPPVPSVHAPIQVPQIGAPASKPTGPKVLGRRPPSSVRHPSPAPPPDCSPNTRQTRPATHVCGHAPLRKWGRRAWSLGERAPSAAALRCAWRGPAEGSSWGAGRCLFGPRPVTRAQRAVEHIMGFDPHFCCVLEGEKS